MKKLRAAADTEVIAEFLRNEFHHHDFDRDRQRFAAIVAHPALGDERENALRRALFYRRRGHMWNQIPRDTAWWEVRLEARDLDRLESFARTHWRKIGGGTVLLRRVVEQIRTRDFRGVRVVGGTAHGGVEISDVNRIVEGVRALSADLRAGHDDSTVVLIGAGGTQHITILEGNHRLAAALLASEAMLTSQFRVFYGESAAMVNCCWYRTNLANMARYAADRLKYFGNREADLDRLLPLLYPETVVAERAAPRAGDPGHAAPGMATK
jgi:hypothetical protein